MHRKRKKEEKVSQKSTSAGTNNDHLMGAQDSELDDDDFETRTGVFNLSKETGERGADPESNKIKQIEDSLIETKREKLVDLIRANQDIHSMLNSDS